MINENQPIDYRFLNMDLGIFAETETELLKHFSPGAHQRIIPKHSHSQILIAIGNNSFTEREAINLCRKLSVLKNSTG